MENSGVAVARQLIVLSGGTKGSVYLLAAPKVGLGRDVDNTIRLEGTCISRHHAVLDRTNGEYTLHDLHSRNGTFLNGQPVQAAHLKPGDRFRLGEIEVSYEAATAPTVTTLTVGSLPAPAEELLDLRRQLAAVQQQLTTAGEQSALQLAKLTQQKDALAANLATARNQAGELRATADRATAETVQVRAQSASIAHEQQQRITQLTADTDRLAAELRAAYESLKTAHSELETVVDLRRQSQELTKRGEELLLQLMTAKAQVEALRLSGDQQAAALQTTTEKQAALAAEVKQLQAQLDQAQQRVGKAAEQNQLLTSERDAARRQLTVLQRDTHDQLAAAQQRAAEQLANLQAELDSARQIASRLPELTNQNARLTSQHSELLAQIAALQSRETQVNPLEAEVATLRDALQRVNAELVEARTTAKLAALTEMVERLAQPSGAAGTPELAWLKAELTQACADWAGLRQLKPVVDQLTRENEELRRAAAKAQDETMVAKRCLSDQTTAEFAQIRRGMPTKPRGNGGSVISGKDGGLLQQLDAARRAFGILPKK